ncbi:MAG: hypothetical protein H5T50_07300 [Nitrososphaeria archaeon]|nr:hypothetical protein [Nitrososphaeria archaeon]
MRENGVKSIVLVALCATLYASLIVLTATIPTPWGVGHFRPAVVIPALFGLIASPLVAAFGAALGTQIGSFMLPTGLGPLGSLISGLPGNFIGFLVYGFIVRGSRSWTRFIVGTIAGTLVGNLIAASGVAFWLTFIVPKWASMSSEALILTIFGLTMFWEVTMVPFIILIVPPVLAALRPLEKRTIFNLNLNPLVHTKGERSTIFSLAVSFCILYIIVAFSPFGSMIFSQVQPLYAEITKIFTLFCGISILIIYLIKLF